MMTILIFAIVLAVLIFVHELGHFVVARQNGIRAEEFGFGFPPRIFGIQRYLDKNGKHKKWRIIFGRRDGDNDNEAADRAEKKEKGYSAGTIYSINWLPLGGFVRIKGEDGEGKNESDSFVSKGAWVRIKVLAAGVIMNFVLAWFLIAIVMVIGIPEAVESEIISEGSKIQISEVVEDSPAEAMGLKVGDEILLSQSGFQIEKIEDIKNYIDQKKGQEVILSIKRGKDLLDLRGSPRIEHAEDQGALGIGYAQIEMKKYPIHIAIWESLRSVFDLIWMMLSALYIIIKNLIVGDKSVGMQITGPVGIVALTGQVASLGLIYVLQFVAILSINLGLINILPIPALDGGRILFILIEKIKGSPVSQKIEQGFHLTFFALLILLMVVITYKDVLKLFK